MNIVYFGNIHTNNVVHFLTKITKLYDKVEIKSVQSYNKINRCIEIKNDIDLDKILNDARKIRNKILPQSSPGRITPVPLIPVPPIPVPPIPVPPIPVPPIHLPVRQPSAHIEPSNIRRQEQICLCINNSSGERCIYKAKLPSKYCGRHQNCRKTYVQIQPLPQQPLPQQPLPQQPLPQQKQPIINRKEQICLCINKSKGKRCENKAKPPSEFCGIHKNCKEVYRLK
jgi:hypothetical protein